MKFKELFRWRKPILPRMMTENGSSFDDLSNDLLFEIFDYLSYNEIFFSFGNLNHFFAQLINNYPHCIHLRFDVHHPKYIRSLKITRNDQLSFFFSFQPSQLASLRAITLCNLRAEQVDEIFNVIPSQQLEYVYLGVCAFDAKVGHMKMVSTVQTKILALTQYRLKQIRLKENFSVQMDLLPQTLVALEDLQLVACPNFFVLSEVLSRTPNLKSLHVSTMDIHRNPLVLNSFPLTSLCLRPHLNCTIEELSLFLRQCCSGIQNLRMELPKFIRQCKESCLSMNKDQWMKIFPPQLQSFHLKSLSSSSVHLVKLCNERYKPPLRQTLDRTFSGVEEDGCQILIDGFLVQVWNET